MILRSYDYIKYNGIEKHTRKEINGKAVELSSKFELI